VGRAHSHVQLGGNLGWAQRFSLREKEKDIVLALGQAKSAGGAAIFFPGRVRSRPGKDKPHVGPAARIGIDEKVAAATAQILAREMKTDAHAADMRPVLLSGGGVAQTEGEIQARDAGSGVRQINGSGLWVENDRHRTRHSMYEVVGNLAKCDLGDLGTPLVQCPGEEPGKGARELPEIPTPHGEDLEKAIFTRNSDPGMWGNRELGAPGANARNVQGFHHPSCSRGKDQENTLESFGKTENVPFIHMETASLGALKEQKNKDPCQRQVPPEGHHAGKTKCFAQLFPQLLKTPRG